ncbi:hypothetical protein ABIE78_006858 [Sinorhizobium fredii]
MPLAEALSPKSAQVVWERTCMNDNDCCRIYRPMERSWSSSPMKQL